MTTLFIHIKSLVGVRSENVLLRGAALAELPCIDDAFLLVENGIIAAFGPMHELEIQVPDLPAVVMDVTGQFVLPAWCDSHTHAVFARSREEEFVDKLKGKTYAEIAANGGGILNSARVLAETEEDELFRLAMSRLKEIAAMGTGAIEIKSGYGLSLESELKMLRVIKRLKQHSNLSIKASFLGAHALPVAYKDDRAGYIRLIIDEMLPVIAAEDLADYIDVFCEKGFFSVEEMETICTAGAQYGLKPKLHVNQLNSIGGIQAGIALGAVSLDHLETMTESDVNDLAKSDTV
ncbi:MAG: imidazolonepropionase, partial [Sphingobacteriales bacterium]